MGPGTNNPPGNEAFESELGDEKIESRASNNSSDMTTIGRTKTHEEIEEEKRDEEIYQLARKYTTQSHRSVYNKNPFEEREKEDSDLNPASPNFNPKAFAKSLLNLQARDPEKWKQRTAGISFKDLNVYGYGSGTDYQKDVVRYGDFELNITDWS